MSNLEIVALIAAAILALIHLFAGKLRFLEGIPRSRWLSLAGGASIAYVFLHLLPRTLLLFALAMALHFVVNDFGLREHHKHLYRRIGR